MFERMVNELYVKVVLENACAVCSFSQAIVRVVERHVPTNMRQRYADAIMLKHVS